MSMNVLIVDDHAIMREGLSALLTGAGMQVVGMVGNGRDAMQAVRELLDLETDLEGQRVGALRRIFNRLV